MSPLARITCCGCPTPEQSPPKEPAVLELLRPQPERSRERVVLGPLHLQSEQSREQVVLALRRPQSERSRERAVLELPHLPPTDWLTQPTVGAAQVLRRRALPSLRRKLRLPIWSNPQAAVLLLTRH